MVDLPTRAGTGEPSGNASPPPLAVLLAVFRRLGPQLVEATLVPSALCYLGLLTVGLTWGAIAAGCWTALSILRRVLAGRQVSGLLVLAATGLVVRISVYLLSESAFVYFVQPVARTGATALLFTVSAVAGRPLVARFARDFCSFDATVGSRPAVVALFKRLTLLWAAAQAAIAIVQLTLLVTLPVALFMAIATGAMWLIVGACVVVTVADSVRTTRSDGLRTVLARGGHLHAFA